MTEKAEYCWQCGTLLVQGASFCKRCGAKAKIPEEDLPEGPKFQNCSRCGSKVSPRAAFCPNCALELARSSPPSPSPLPSSPLGHDPAQPRPTGPMPPFPRDYAEVSRPVDYDRSLSMMEGVLLAISNLFIPYAIPGIVGWAVWRGKYPRRARQALFLSIVVFAIYAIIVLLIIEFRPDLLPQELRRLLDEVS